MLRDAEIVFDLFHVVAKFGLRGGFNRVRVDEGQLAWPTTNQPAEVVKARAGCCSGTATTSNGQRRPDPPRRAAAPANHALMTDPTCLKEDLKGLWKQRTKSAAKAAWESWFCRAIESAIKPLVTFARKLEAYLPGIIAHAT